MDSQTALCQSSEPDGASAGEDFVELGLLFIVTGLTTVVLGAAIQLLLLRGSEIQPSWVAFLIGGVAVGGLGLVAFRLIRRLLWFLRRMR